MKKLRSLQEILAEQENKALQIQRKTTNHLFRSSEPRLIVLYDDLMLEMQKAVADGTLVKKISTLESALRSPSAIVEIEMPHFDREPVEDKEVTVVKEKQYQPLSQINLTRYDVPKEISGVLKIALRECDNDPLLRNNPFLAYFIARKIEIDPDRRRVFGLRNIREILEKERGIKPPMAQVIGYDTFFSIQQLLRNDVLSGQYKYFVPEGLYLAAKDLDKESKILPISVTHHYTHKKRNLSSFLLMQESEIRGHWNPVLFEANLKNIEALLSFLRKKYHKNSDLFFRTYGSVSGTQNLAEEIKGEKNISIQSYLKALSGLISDGEMLSRMIGISDDRFRTHWNPQTILLTREHLDIVKETLQTAYRSNPDRFYEVYGSHLGEIVLSKQLRNEKGVDISPERLNTVLIKPQKVKDLIESDDKNFAKRWNVRYVKGKLDDLETIVEHLKSSYERDASAFFNRYGCDVGAYHIAEDMFKESKEQRGEGKNISLGAISSLVKEGVILPKLMGVPDDERFLLEWSPARMVGSYRNAVVLLDFLKKSYNKDKDGFFERYGCNIGLYNLMKDTNSAEITDNKFSQGELSVLVMNGERLSQLLDDQDPRFSTHWHPKMVLLNAEQIDSVVDFLRGKYGTDKDAFFERYGCEEGLLKLEDDLKKERKVGFSAQQLMTVAKDPEMVANLLGIRDERFRTAWNLRSIQVAGSTARRVGEFLRQSYDANPIRFFVRYGGISGQYLLMKDLREQCSLEVPPVQLNSLVGKQSLVAKITGIPESNFENKWRSKPIYVNLRQLDRMVDFIKERYNADANQFFERYGCEEGILEVIDGLRSSKKITPNLHHLTCLLKNGEFLSAITGIEDPRFKSKWNFGTVSVSNEQMALTRTFLRREYSAGPEGFIKRYGCPTGLYNLACDLKERGFLRTSHLGHLGSLLNRRIISEIIGVSEDNLKANWRPREIGFNLQNFQALINYLKTNLEENSGRFFKHYGGKLGIIILAGEAKKYLNLSLNLNNIRNVICDSQFFGEAIEGDGDRFVETLGKRNIGHYAFGLNDPTSFNTLEKIVVGGLQRMAESCELPYRNDAFDKKDPYLLLRYGLRYADTETILYIADLYHEASSPRVKQNVLDSVGRDKDKLPLFESIHSEEEVAEFGEANFTELVGHLLYSFDPNVRNTAQGRLVEMYNPLYNQLVGEGSENHTVAQLFMNYCKNFDVYGIKSGDKYQANFVSSFRHTLGGLVKYWFIQQRGEKNRKGTISLDAPFGEGGEDERTYYDTLS